MCLDEGAEIWGSGSESEFAPAAQSVLAAHVAGGADARGILAMVEPVAREGPAGDGGIAESAGGVWAEGMWGHLGSFRSVVIKYRPSILICNQGSMCKAIRYR